MCPKQTGVPAFWRKPTRTDLAPPHALAAAPSLYACLCLCFCARRDHPHTHLCSLSFCPLFIPTHQRALLNVPRVFAISLVWPRDTTTATELTATLKLLEQDLDIAELFTLVGAQSVARALCSNKCPLAVQVGDSHTMCRAHVNAGATTAQRGKHLPHHRHDLLLWTPLHGRHSVTVPEGLAAV